MTQADNKTQSEEFTLSAKEAFNAYQASRLLKGDKTSFQIKTRNGRSWFDRIERTQKDGKRLYSLQGENEDSSPKTKLVEADDVLTIRIRKSP